MQAVRMSSLRALRMPCRDERSSINTIVGWFTKGYGQARGSGRWQQEGTDFTKCGLVVLRSIHIAQRSRLVFGVGKKPNSIFRCFIKQVESRFPCSDPKVAGF